MMRKHMEGTYDIDEGLRPEAIYLLLLITE